MPFGCPDREARITVGAVPDRETRITVGAVPDREASRQPVRLQKASDLCHGLMVFAACRPPLRFAVRDRSYGSISATRLTL